MLRRALLSTLIAIGGIAVSAPACWACSCAVVADRDQQRAAYVEGAHVIFTGVVTAVEIEPNDPGSPIGDEEITVEFEVESAYKGRVGFTFTLDGGRTGNTCNVRFFEGERYTVFAYGSGGDYTTNICSGTRAGRIDAERWPVSEKLHGVGGAGRGDHAGASLDSVGDVNRDGGPDLLVGAPGADPQGRRGAGAAFVVYGRDRIASTDLGAIPQQVEYFPPRHDRGYALMGAAPGDAAGRAVASVGDVNGDGVGDIAVGAPRADAGGADSGRAYVVFGGGGTSLDLAALGARGYRIDGAAAGDLAGLSLAGAGDVNGDGLADVIVGAPHAHERAGSAYVLFGKRDLAAVDLGALGAGGYEVVGVEPEGELGWSVADGGDVDGDRLRDQVLGAPFASPRGRAAAGSAFVVSGQTTTARIDLASFDGYRIDGPSEGASAGYSVTSLSDADGDGVREVVVGAPRASLGGSAYVVLDAGADVDLAVLGDHGYAIRGARSGDWFGASVAEAGDVNGDGRSDLVVGAPRHPQDVRAGHANVVFGQTATRTIGVGERGAPAYELSLGRRRDRFGFAVAPAGDANADGTPDVVVGAPRARFEDRRRAGFALISF